MKLTGQSFGPPHIIAVLRGSRAKRVVSRRHDRLSVFGAGRVYSTEQWRALAQQFIRLGLLEQDLEFGGLRLVPKGWEVLNGKRKALVPRQWAPVPTADMASSERSTSTPNAFRRFSQPPARSCPGGTTDNRPTL